MNDKPPLTATLTIPNKDHISCSVYEGSLGYPVIDVSNLSKNEVFTYDPGFMSTAACKSSITYIDGDAGILLHRGYDIGQLAEHGDYLEICYLLLYGELPTKSAKQTFVETVKHHTLVHEQIIDFFDGFPRSSHPMAIMCGVVGGLSAFYHNMLNINNKEQRDLIAIQLIAKMPTLAATSYKYAIGQPFVYPKNYFSYAENFLHMMFSIPANKEEDPDPVLVKALDTLLILHADHEQNASTSTVRTAGSSGANPFACIAAGIAALWGPAHGGANEAVLNMLEEIDDVKNINKFILRAKDKTDTFRLMGFGHRVYKNFDPRAKVIKKICHELLEHLNLRDHKLFKLALELEKIALEDEYFQQKKLYPNVDFYSGIVLQALKIPKSMFTVIFALGRTVGWISHWREMVAEGNMKINRPRQLYVGPKLREYVTIENRNNT